LTKADDENALPQHAGFGVIDKSGPVAVCAIKFLLDEIAISILFVASRLGDLEDSRIDRPSIRCTENSRGCIAAGERQSSDDGRECDRRNSRHLERPVV